MGQLSQILKEIRSALATLSDTPGLDAQVLLAHVLEKPRSWVMAHPEAILNPQQIQTLETCLQRLLQGEPLPYVLGEWQFFGLGFEVTPATLIPRPETELMVEQALAWLRLRALPDRVVDVGVGTGCVAVSLAVHLPRLSVLGVDISWAALQVARQNACRHAVESRVQLLQTDLVSSLCGPFDLVCANLPYIPSDTVLTLPAARHEPRLALDDGVDGLDLIRRLLNQVSSRMATNSLCLLEIEASQGPLAQRLGEETFHAAQVQVLADLAGKDRLLCIQLGE